MIQPPGFLLTVLAFALVLGPLVFLHEMGHYWAGRWFGVKAEAFSIGFGREIAGFTDKRGTRWKFGWLPFGGYVRFAGDMNPASQPDADWLRLPPAERNRTFQAKSVWQRAIIVAAGPAANFLVAIAILSVFAAVYGIDRTPSIVGGVVPGSGAATAGLEKGDRIKRLGDRSVSTYMDMARYTVLRPDETIGIDLVRDGQPMQIHAKIGVHQEVDRFGNKTRMGRLGIEPSDPVYSRLGPLSALSAGISETIEAVRLEIDGIAQIVTGRLSVDQLGGPVRIAKVSGEQLALGPVALIFFIANISINLGFINLLPVPVLDGGHLLFYAIEAVRRRPVGQQAVEWAFRGGLAAIMTLAVFVTVNDLSSVGLWHHLAGLIG